MSYKNIDNFNYPVISKEEFKISVANLNHLGIDMYDNPLIFKNTPGGIYRGVYKSDSFKRSNLSDCHFVEAFFDDCSWTSSTFFHVSFKKTPFINSNASFCSFNECDFLFDTESSLPKIKTSNFSYANIFNTTFENVEIINSTFDNVYFYNTIFCNGKITQSTFENTIFENTSFYHMDMSNLNLDFAEFNHIKMEDVTLSFYQMPYIFGGLSYFLNTEDDVWVYGEETRDKKISPSKYRELLPDLISYYQYYQEYFPIANIYIATGNMEQALQAIYMGIENSAMRKDFRMLKFFCKLAAKSKKFPYELLQSIYDRIYNLHQLKNMTPQENRIYFSQLGEIRKTLLFDDTDKVTMEICIKTNIETEQSEKTGVLIREIENAMSQFTPVGVIYNLELKHHCPWDIIITIIAMEPVIRMASLSLQGFFSTAQSLTSLLSDLSNVYKTLKDSFGNKDHQKQIKAQEIEENQLKIELYKKQTLAAEKQAEFYEEQTKLVKKVNEIDLTELTNIIKIASQNMCVNGITATITQKANG